MQISQVGIRQSISKYPDLMARMNHTINQEFDIPRRTGIEGLILFSDYLKSNTSLLRRRQCKFSSGLSAWEIWLTGWISATFNHHRQKSELCVASHRIVIPSIRSENKSVPPLCQSVGQDKPSLDGMQYIRERRSHFPTTHSAISYRKVFSPKSLRNLSYFQLLFILSSLQHTCL